MNILELEQGILAGNRRALARAITMVEKAQAGIDEMINRLQTRNNGTWVIGITGPPGAGKSSLVDRIGASFAQKGRKVAILAVDPSSPFSGGAILGDRLRMENSIKSGVYVRSMGSRGRYGGLAPAIEDILILLSAAGNELILLETVGAGQSEVAIRNIAHTVLVTTVPGLGDGIQALKAGVMEIGDVFCVNKSDLGGADMAAAALEEIMFVKKQEDGWSIPVVKVSALTEEGLDQLVSALEAHQQFLLNKDHMQHFKRKAIATRLESLVCREIIERIKLLPDNFFEKAVAEVEEGRADPVVVTRNILKKLDFN